MTWVQWLLVAYAFGLVADVFASRGIGMRWTSALLCAPLWPFTLLARLLNRI